MVGRALVTFTSAPFRLVQAVGWKCLKNLRIDSSVARLTT